jgi:hypothetical protein
MPLLVGRKLSAFSREQTIGSNPSAELVSRNRFISFVIQCIQLRVKAEE